MSESKDETKKIKRTSSKKKEKETAKETIGPPTRIIWLYGAHPGIIKAALLMLLDYGSQKSNQLRQSLGLTLKDTVLPVYPYPANARTGIIQELSGVSLNDTCIVVFGMPTDQKNKALHKLYKNTEVVWVHPSERQFHISMMRETVSISYKEAEEAQQEWGKFFSKHFDKKNTYLIRT